MKMITISHCFRLFCLRFPTLKSSLKMIDGYYFARNVTQASNLNRYLDELDFKTICIHNGNWRSIARLDICSIKI